MSVLGTLALALVVGASQGVDPKKEAQQKDPPPCDLNGGKTTKVLECQKCSAAVPKSEIKDKKHSKDEGELKEVEYCIKKCYKSECCPAKIGDKPFKC